MKTHVCSDVQQHIFRFFNVDACAVLKVSVRISQAAIATTGKLVCSLGAELTSAIVRSMREQLTTELVRQHRHDMPWCNTPCLCSVANGNSHSLVVHEVTVWHQAQYEGTCSIAILHVHMFARPRLHYTT
jgi:hypothetical protein